MAAEVALVMVPPIGGAGGRPRADGALVAL
jgi:hypothetical protein